MRRRREAGETDWRSREAPYGRAIFGTNGEDAPGGLAEVSPGRTETGLWDGRQPQPRPADHIVGEKMDERLAFDLVEAS